MREVGWWLALGLANLAVILGQRSLRDRRGTLRAPRIWCCRRRASIWPSSSRGTTSRPTITVTTSSSAHDPGPWARRSWPLRVREARRLTADVSRQRRTSAAFAGDPRRRAGLDGVFAYDHLLPIGSTRTADPRALACPGGRGRLVAPRCGWGPLVARVALVSYGATRRAVRDLGGPRAGSRDRGAGDRRRTCPSTNTIAYGLAYPSASERTGLLVDAVAALSPLVDVWCGAGSPATNASCARATASLSICGACPR